MFLSFFVVSLFDQPLLFLFVRREWQRVIDDIQSFLSLLLRTRNYFFSVILLRRRLTGNVQQMFPQRLFVSWNRDCQIWWSDFPFSFWSTSLYKYTSSSSFHSFTFHLHHVHPFTPNCKKLALIYTLPSSSGSVWDDPSEYGGDVIATTIDCCTLSLTGAGIGSSWCGVPPFKWRSFCCCCGGILSTSTTWIGTVGVCITPELDPRFTCAFSIKSIDVVVVGVVGAPDENLMLYGCRFVSFYSCYRQRKLVRVKGGGGGWWRWQDLVLMMQ